MKKLHVRLSHPHARTGADAQAALERLIAAVGRRFDKYNFQHQFQDEHKSKITFSFDRPDKGKGTGRAELANHRVDVEIEADWNVPFFVPTAMAEFKVKEELMRALLQAFGR